MNLCNNYMKKKPKYLKNLFKIHFSFILKDLKMSTV